MTPIYLILTDASQFVKDPELKPDPFITRLRARTCKRIIDGGNRSRKEILCQHSVSINVIRLRNHGHWLLYKAGKECARNITVVEPNDFARKGNPRINGCDRSFS